VERRQQSIFFLRIGSHGSQSCLVARAESVFPRRSLGDCKDAATYTEECKEEGLNTALQLLTDYLNAVPEATTVRRPWDK
jgi:hypothetical protein